MLNLKLIDLIDYLFFARKGPLNPAIKKLAKFLFKMRIHQSFNDFRNKSIVLPSLKIMIKFNKTDLIKLIKMHLQKYYFNTK